MESEHLHRPFRFFDPTRADFITPHLSGAYSPQPSKWSSRASRKNRYSVQTFRIRRDVQTALAKEAEITTSPSTARDFVVVRQKMLNLSSQLKIRLAWDISFWVAVVFVLGSTAWIVNGFYLFLPLLNIGGDHGVTAAWWGLAGGTLFEIGSYLMLVESLNTGHDELFGPAVWGLVPKRCSLEKVDALDDKEKVSVSMSEQSGREPNGSVPRQKPKFRWIGLGSWRDLGYLACSIQMFAATIFWVSTITGLPGVIPNFPEHPSVAITDVFFWTPQVIGGCGFIIASILLTIEAQTAWYKPNLTSKGWHVGFWNLVGAFGFMLCGALGYAAATSSGANYQSVLSTFWGSWAFEIGSVIQLWESVWREAPQPKEGNMKSSVEGSPC
ncbi:hypothetical protein C8Q75DRAFT_712544 [Abortiporus biennis]|nr:hypothetical protein C8Q75DRAFT_712544 [Abortiporus biennis]